MVGIFMGLSLVATACGDAALTTPQSLERTIYQAGEVRLSFVMSRCSDTCLEYGTATCTSDPVNLLDIDSSTGNLTLDFDINVPYSRREGGNPKNPDAILEECSLECGPKVLAHCTTTLLGAGSYQVNAGDFSTTIEVVSASGVPAP